jgi:hypothetical protein
MDELAWSLDSAVAQKSKNEVNYRGQWRCVGKYTKNDENILHMTYVLNC